jgi:hypothetical protein
MGLSFEPRRPEREVPQPPSAFFDGTRLGLEATMLATLAIAIPAGLHIGLSVVLGYATRYADGLPPAAKAFSLGGFVFASLLAIIAMSMLLFFGGSIPTMAYSMGLVALMLRWVGRRHGRERLTSTILGTVLGLLFGGMGTAVLFLLMSMTPSAAAYATMFRWPAILRVDGIALLWLTLNPLANAIAGGQIGWRLGKQLENLTMYWFM